MAELDSPIITQKEELADKQVSLPMDARESEHYALIFERIIRARNHREQTRDEFDDMTYEQDYLANKRAAISYLTRKKNDDEVRVNTGTTEKKIEFVFNELLDLNIQSDVAAYDQDDNKLVALGNAYSDIVRRTEEIEQADEKDLWIFTELLTQRAVFVQELWNERKTATVGKKRTFKKTGRPERRLWQGIQVYLGDIFLPDYRFQEQPYLVRYARMTYEMGKTIFGDLERWNYVTPGAYMQISPLSSVLYRRGALMAHEIEVWEYVDAPNREHQLVINGVPQLEVGSDLPWEWDGYDMEMVSLKPTSNDWAYGKPLTASAKALQGLENETLRNIIRKMRQALEPPMGIIGGKTLTRDIWAPGTVVQGIRKDDFQKLIDHAGVTRSEMAMMDFINTKIGEFIGTSQMSSLAGRSRITATEYSLILQQAAKMLGNAVIAIIRLKNKMTMLRVKNINQHYLNPIGQEVDPITKKLRDAYASFSIDNVALNNGKMGTRVIKLMDKSLSDEEKMSLFKEEQASAKAGKNVEFKGINVKIIKDIDLYFHINSISKPKQTNDLDRAVFTDKLAQGVQVSQITGMPLNKQKVVDSFEKVWKEKDFFEKNAPQASMPGGMPPEMGGGEGAGAPAPSVNPPFPVPGKSLTNKPSLNTLMGPKR